MSSHFYLSLIFIRLYTFLSYGAFFNKALQDFDESKYTKFT
jgi:hypothetical protein